MQRLLIKLILLVFIINGCQSSEEDGMKKKQKKIFTLMDMSETGFDYINRIVEDENLNELSYEYFYNGAGVTVGDINNDGLPDVLMGGNMFGARLFLNLGNLKFKDITEQAGLATNGYQTGVSMVDINNDGFLDIYICRSMFNDVELRKNLLFINNQNGTFSEKGLEYGLDDPGFSNQASFFDYDMDGDLDMFLTNHRADFFNVLYIIPEKDWRAELEKMKKDKGDQYLFFSNKLYRNNGNATFSDVTIGAGLMSYDYTLSATIADVNMDGLGDIYVTADYATKDHLYINKGNGEFKDEIDEQMKHISKNSMGSDIADYNNDGLSDIVTLDMVSEDNYRQKQLRGFAPYDIFKSIAEYKLHYQVEGNCLQLNNGMGAFSEIGKFAGVAYTDWSWAPLFADFNNDGFKDLFITNGYARDITDMDYIKYISPEIVNRSGGPQKVNKLELLNSVKSTPIKNYLYRNNGDLKFTNATDDWGLTEEGFSNGSAYVDLDLDGDLDLIVNNFNQIASLYRNDARNQYPENNYIAIKLQGDKMNPFAIGAKVWVNLNGKEFYQENYASRGFLSAMATPLNFGLGDDKGSVKLVIQWPNGSLKVLEGVQSNKLLTINYHDGRDSIPSSFDKGASLLTSLLHCCSPNYVHEESGFIDFKTDALLEFSVSQMGPWISTGDVDKNGMDDFFIGGSVGKAGSLYLQTQHGQFVLKVQPDLALHVNQKDASSLLVDFDKDGDLDLFITSGFSDNHQPQNFGGRLYLNDGKGNFTLAPNAIPKWDTPAETAVNIDYDGDGDEDIFVGGSPLLGKFPLSGKSFMLKNNHGVFSRVDILPNGGELGIIQDAMVMDMNNDKKNDLILAGSWEPIKVLLNSNGEFKDATKKYGFDETDGLWYCLEKADIDGDGDIDIIAGNRGTNISFPFSKKKPGILSYQDLDDNGMSEGMISYHYRDGKLYPKYSFDQITLQAPGLKSLFTSYKSYSMATSQEVVGKDKWDKARKWYLKEARTILFRNNGNGDFKAEPLNPETQFFPVKDVMVSDINEDGKLDILLVGNHYETSPEIGREDAGYGVLLQGNGDGRFSVVTNRKSGFYLPLDSRKIVRLSSKQSKPIILVANNQGPLQFFKWTK